MRSGWKLVGMLYAQFGNGAASVGFDYVIRVVFYRMPNAFQDWKSSHYAVPKEVRESAFAS